MNLILYYGRCMSTEVVMLIFLHVKGLRKYILFVRLFRCSGLREMYIHWSSYTHRIACISGFIPQHMYLVKLYPIIILHIALGGQTVSYILPVTLAGRLCSPCHTGRSHWEVKLYHNVFSLSHWEVKLYHIFSP